MQCLQCKNDLGQPTFGVPVTVNSSILYERGQSRVCWEDGRTKEFGGICNVCKSANNPLTCGVCGSACCANYCESCGATSELGEIATV
jgi:hypothetical protein